MIFTASIQGSVEVEDQVHALTYAAKHFFPLLDLDRVGVTGWSYGKQLF